MDPLLIAVIVVAAGGDTPWPLLGAIAGSLVALITAMSAVGAYKAKRIGDTAQNQLDYLKLSMDSMKDSLDRAETEITRLDAHLTATRAELDGARSEITQLKMSMSDERRRHADRVKVLAREIRRLGGSAEEDDDRPSG